MVKIFLSINIFCLVAWGQIKKNQPLPFQVDDNKYITWGDLNDLKIMIGGVAVIGLGHLVLAIMKYAWGKQEDNSEDIKELKQMVQELMIEVRHRPTHDEVKRISREEVEYARRITDT